MTTYNGRKAGYIPGLQPVNKEPPVAKYVVEKLYRVHRERLGKVESLTDCHLTVMDFLQDQGWKKTAAIHKEAQLMRHNEAMFERLAKVENSESLLAREKRDHVKKVTEGAKIMKRLKESDRQRKLLRIQKENEYMHSRIERTRAEYTIEKCNEWYKHHELFKRGRRSDVTAGHIMRIPKSLLPKSLPPLDNDDSRLSTMSATDGVSRRSYHRGSTHGGNSSVVSLSTANSATHSLSMSMLPDEASVFIAVPTGTFTDPMNSPKRYRKLTSPIDSVNLSAPQSRGSESGSSITAAATAAANNLEQLLKRKASLFRSSFSSSVGGPGFFGADESEASLTGQSDSVDANSMSNTSINVETNGVLASTRQFAIPFEQKNCLVKAYLNACVYDENIYFHIVTALEGEYISDRVLHVDAAFEILESLTFLPQAAVSEDVVQLRTLLVNMFREADKDESGTLTFDEFYALMQKIELGITSQELRFVLSEADENADGVVDYEEFVPVAVDMIAAFRARTKARKQQVMTEASIDEAIHASLRSNNEVDRIARICLEKIQAGDPKGLGVIRTNDLRRRLNGLSAVGLSSLEINMICQSLPRDPFGRCVYATFRDVLYEVRFLSMKNMIVESQGSSIQSLLLDMCKAEEQKVREQSGDDAVVPGTIPFKTMVNIMVKSPPRLSLNRLQIMVIMSEAHVVDGLINYHQFVPVAARAIELMFEPNAMRMRSELLDNADLTAKGLLQSDDGERPPNSEEELQKRLVYLFQSFDFNQSGDLDAQEFASCMRSLEFGLSEGEIFALMASADLDHSGTVSFEEFVSFCSHNLFHLEQEKRLRKLEAESAKKSKKKSMAGGEKVFESMLSGHLLTVFQESDKNGNGFLDSDEIQDLLLSLDVDLTQYQLDVLVSEMDTNDDNEISYTEFVPVCAQLLQSFRVRCNTNDPKGAERAMTKTANKLTAAYTHELDWTANLLTDKLIMLSSTVADRSARRSMIRSLLHDPFTGLCRTEANMLLAKICPSSSAPGQGICFKQRATTSASAVVKESDFVLKSRDELFSELSVLCRRVRETTIKRGLLDPPCVSEVEEILKSRLRGESVVRTFVPNVSDADESGEMGSRPRTQSKASERDAHNVPIALPSSNKKIMVPMFMCLRELLEESTFRLTLTQALHIVSWATDCYESGTNQMVDYQKFARYAAEKILWFAVEETLENRYEVLTQLSSQGFDETFSESITEDLFQAYVEASFARHSEECSREDADNISESQLVSVLMNLPFADTFQPLTELEALSVISSLYSGFNSEGVIRWRDISLKRLFFVLCRVLRERIMGRRMMMLYTVLSLQSAACDEHSEGASTMGSPNCGPGTFTRRSSKSSLTASKSKKMPLLPIIEQLFDVLKLIPKNGTLSVVFPMEGKEAATNRLRSSVVGGEHGAPKRSQSTMDITEGAMLFVDNADNLDDFYEAECILHMEESLPVSTGRPQTGSKSSPHLMTVHKHSVRCRVKVYAAPTAAGALEKPLLIDVESVDAENPVGSFKIIGCAVPVRLPSIGLVDPEAALEFMKNVVDRVVLAKHKSSVTVNLTNM